jgi:hypothetical protein
MAVLVPIATESVPATPSHASSAKAAARVPATAPSVLNA